jgi:Fe-S-cluster containining protein
MQNKELWLIYEEFGKDEVSLTEHQSQGHQLVKNKIDNMFEQHPWIVPQKLNREFHQIVSENSSAKSKRRKIIEIVDRVTAALTPYVACQPGCSSCCKLNTMIYEHEAINLASVTGRKMVRLTYRPPSEVFKKGKSFIGKPCPFLADNKCSVYGNRPLVCRTHHSLNNDATLCSLDNSNDNQDGPPMYDPDIFEDPYMRVNAPYEPLGNINEFFPA